MKDTLRGYLAVTLLLAGVFILIYDEEIELLGKKLGTARARLAALERETIHEE